jgi:hypothetical protein
MDDYFIAPPIAPEALFRLQTDEIQPAGEGVDAEKLDDAPPSQYAA